jgi:hypothetical protein
VTGRSPYTVTSVTQVPGDPTAYVLQLSKPLGGGNPVTGVAPTTEENGDRITVTVPDAGVAGAFSTTMNVLQGDTDHFNEGANHVVLARDYSEIKKKFFKNTNSVPEGNAETDYSIFHDIDGTGNILARDYSEVKKRFFQSLAPPPVAAEDMFSATRISDEVLK